MEDISFLSDKSDQTKKEKDGTASSGFFSSLFSRGKKKQLSIDFEEDFKEDVKSRNTRIDKALGQVTPRAKGPFSIPLDPSVKEEKNVDAGVDDIASYRKTFFDRIIDKWLKKKEKEEMGSGVGMPASRSSAIPQISSDNIAAASLETGAAEEKAKEQKSEDNKIEIKKEEKKKDDKILSDSNVLETNLMEGASISFFDWRQNVTILVVVSVIAAIVVGIGYAGLVVYGSQQEKASADTDNQISELNQQIQIAERDTEQFLPLQNKIKLVSELLAKHIYWTKFFKFLEDNTISDIFYANFSGDNKGKYNIAGHAKNFNDLTEQLKAFKAQTDYVSQVNINGGKLSTPDKDKSSGVDFGMDITFNPKIFYKP